MFLSYVLLNAHINLIKAYRLLVGGLMSSGKSFVSYLSPLRWYEVYGVIRSVLPS